VTAKDEIGSFDASVRPALCTSCGAEIVWCRTITGKATPMQADENGEWIIVQGIAHRGQSVGVQRYTSHFATCPQASSWRKRK
jgi:hypothetical protein